MMMQPEHRHHVLAIREEVFNSLGLQQGPPAGVVTVPRRGGY